MENLYESLVWYIVFLFSVTLHEAAHAFFAKMGGDMTAYLGGQVSLDPIPHIRRSPFGMVVLPIVSLLMFGWPLGFASAPYDPLWADRYPRRAGLMALAGPASNFALVLLAAIGIRIGMAMDVFTLPSSIQFSDVAMSADPGFWSGAAFFVGVLFTLNLVLTVLNLIPVPPLDGSGVVTIFMPEEMARKFNNFFQNPIFSVLGIMVAWKIFGPVFRVIFHLAINVLYLETSYGPGF